MHFQQVNSIGLTSPPLPVEQCYFAHETLNVIGHVKLFDTACTPTRK